LALLDVTTLQERRTLLHSVPAEMRPEVLRAANPKLVAELERIATNPRRCRDLTAESVEEIITWCADEDTLVGILENDTRTGVATAVRSRLHAIGSDLTARQNAKNIRDRTERAVSASDPLEALSDLKEVDTDILLKWYTALPAMSRDQVLLRVLSLRNYDISLVVSVLRRSISGEDLTSPAQIVRAAACSPAAVTTLLGTPPASMSLRLAEAIVTAKTDAYAVPLMAVDADAIDELVEAGRVDLLAKLECVPADTVSKLVTDASMLEAALSAASSPAYVDVLAARLSPRSKMGYGTMAANALGVPGISPESRYVLLTYANASTAVEVFSGACGDRPTAEEAARFVTWLGQDRDSVSSLVQAINRAHYVIGADDSKPDMAALLDALYEHGENLLVVLTKSYYSYSYNYRGSHVSEYVMARAADVIGDTPGAWEAFFTAAPSHTGTVSDLATAVVLAAA
jgi:hypothetical protein